MEKAILLVKLFEINWRLGDKEKYQVIRKSTYNKTNAFEKTLYHALRSKSKNKRNNM